MTPTQDYERELEAREFRWDAARMQRVMKGTMRLVQTERVARSAGIVALVVSVIATLGIGSHRWDRQPTPAAILPVEEAARIVRTLDGSTITLEGRDSEANIREQSRERVTIELTRGRGRFEVTRNPGRLFNVESADVTVTVVGTEFVVERRGDRTNVHVTKGTVRVSWPGGDDLLHAGGEGLYPPLAPENHPLEGAAPPSDEVRGEGDKPAAAAGEPRKQKPVLTNKLGSSSASQLAANLLRDADAARIAGHDDEAIQLLRRLTREYPEDARAPMAAFVLGRILAAKGRSNEAMQAFSEARRPGQGDALGEDALARQVEVAAESGDHATAHRLADEFLRTYPMSSRAKQVKRLGELL
jgi:transmembrane sensor